MAFWIWRRRWIDRAFGSGCHLRLGSATKIAMKVVSLPEFVGFRFCLGLGPKNIVNGLGKIRWIGGEVWRGDPTWLVGLERDQSKTGQRPWAPKTDSHWRLSAPRVAEPKQSLNEPTVSSGVGRCIPCRFFDSSLKQKRMTDTGKTALGHGELRFWGQLLGPREFDLQGFLQFPFWNLQKWGSVQ